MRLKQSALWAAAGIIYLFLSRAAGTLWPQMFYSLSAARINLLLSLLAAGTLFLFFLLFYREFTLVGKKGEQMKNERLGRATLFAMTGSIFLALFIAGGISRVFDMGNVFPVETQITVTVFLLLAVAICWVYFYAVFYEEASGKISNRLLSATKLAVWGSSIGLLLRIYLMLRLYYPSQFRWNGALSSGPLLILIPMMLFVFFSTVYFFWVFYQEQ